MSLHTILFPSSNLSIYMAPSKIVYYSRQLESWHSLLFRFISWTNDTWYDSLLRTKQKWQDQVLCQHLYLQEEMLEGMKRTSSNSVTRGRVGGGAGLSLASPIGNGKPQVVSGREDRMSNKTRNRSPSGGKRWWGIRRGKIGRKHRERDREDFIFKEKQERTADEKEKKMRKQDKHEASVGVCTVIV